MFFQLSAAGRGSIQVFLTLQRMGLAKATDNNDGEEGEIYTALDSSKVSLKWSPAKLIFSVPPTGFSD